MFLNRCYEGEMKENMPTMGVMPQQGCMNQECTCPPVMECPCERVCHRQICYDVPHIIPINTKIVNHHIYRHTYQPMYTCTMEDEVSNVYDNGCGF